MFGGSDFRGPKRKFIIGQSPKILGIFQKICTINKKNLKNIEKILEKSKIFQNFF